MARSDLDRLLLFSILQDGERRRPELERRVALEEDEQLLVGGMAVRRRPVVAGLEVAVVDAGVLRARLAREQHPPPGLALVGGVGSGQADGARRLGLARVERRRLRRRRKEQRRQAVVAGAEQRRIVWGRVDDAVARFQPVAVAGDDEEHVFGGAARELGGFARRELEAAETDGDRACRLREVGVVRELIPVGEQAVPQ